MVASTLVFAFASRDARASSLTLSSTLQLVPGANVLADGSRVFPVPPLPGGFPDPVPATPGFTSGSMTLDFVGGQPSPAPFTFSLFSDAYPFIQTGSGPANVPISLEIDEIRFDGTVTSLPGYIDVNATGTARGSLTVGATVVPFVISGPSSWGADGAPAGLVQGSVSPGRVVLGFQYGEIWAGAAAPLMDVATIDGVTYGVETGMNFWSITYVPEPNVVVLLAIAGAGLALRRRAGRSGAAARRCAARGRGRP
jgi:hypothetical protein